MKTTAMKISQQQKQQKQAKKPGCTYEKVDFSSVQYKAKSDPAKQLSVPSLIPDINDATSIVRESCSQFSINSKQKDFCGRFATKYHTLMYDTYSTYFETIVKHLD